MENDLYALEKLKEQEAYWVEQDRTANIAIVRSQIAAVEQRIAERIRTAEAA